MKTYIDIIKTYGVVLIAVAGAISLIKDNFSSILISLPIIICIMFYNAKYNKDVKSILMKLFFFKELKKNTVLSIITGLSLFTIVVYEISDVNNLTKNSTEELLVGFVSALSLSGFVFYFGCVVGWKIWETIGREDKYPNYLYGKKEHEQCRKRRQNETISVLLLSGIVLYIIYSISIGGFLIIYYSYFSGILCNYSTFCFHEDRRIEEELRYSTECSMET